MQINSYAEICTILVKTNPIVQINSYAEICTILEKWELTENLLAKKKKATYGKVAFGILVGWEDSIPNKIGA